MLNLVYVTSSMVFDPNITQKPAYPIFVPGVQKNRLADMGAIDQRSDPLAWLEERLANDPNLGHYVHFQTKETMSSQGSKHVARCRDRTNVSYTDYAGAVDTGFFQINNQDAIEFVSGYGKKQIKLAVDFLSGSADYRRQRGGGRGQAIAKACGLKGSRGWSPTVLDATAGLAGDAFVLAGEGCAVTLCERHPVPYLLVADAIRRMELVEEGRVKMSQLPLGETPLATAEEDTQSVHSLSSSKQNAVTFDIVYLDPMYSEEGKKQHPAAGKGMQILQSEVGADTDADQLLERALSVANYRVVVKRAKSAPYLGGRAPTRSERGKSTRFDLYCLKSPPGR